MTLRLPTPPCSILLLAGGRGQRMGGQDKGLIEWRGEPLIAHLQRLTRGLSDDLIISCNSNLELYASYADQLVHDDSQDFPGPLAGIRAGLKAARHERLLVLPCDVPQVDTELLLQMLQTASAHPGKPLMLRQGGHWEPLLCVIPTSLLPDVERAWLEGQRSPGKVMRDLGCVALQCPENDARLANLNTPELLHQHNRVAE